MTKKVFTLFWTRLQNFFKPCPPLRKTITDPKDTSSRLMLTQTLLNLQAKCRWEKKPSDNQVKAVCVAANLILLRSCVTSRWSDSFCSKVSSRSRWILRLVALARDTSSSVSSSCLFNIFTRALILSTWSRKIENGSLKLSPATCNFRSKQTLWRFHNARGNKTKKI